MPIICTTKAPRHPDADPQAARGIYWTRLSVRSLGRFTVIVKRAGDAMVCGFAIGARWQDEDAMVSPIEIARRAMPDILCYARRDPNHGKAQREEIARLREASDAIYEAWQGECEYLDALNAAWEDYPPYPHDKIGVLDDRIRELRKPIAGPIHRAVEAALASRGLPPLTAGEVNQIKVLEGT